MDGSDYQNKAILAVLLVVALLARFDAVRVSAEEGQGKADVAAAPMPAALAQATRDIKAARNEQAELTTRKWLGRNEKHASAPLAHYLLGQALYGQKRFEEAHKSHDKAYDSAKDRSLKALALFARADSSFKLKKYEKAGRSYLWVDHLYRDVTAVPQDELFFKMGMCEKLRDNPDSANHWFEKVVELYATGPFAEEARRMHTKLGPSKSTDSNFYSVELGSYKDEAQALKEAEIFRKKGYRGVHVVKLSGMFEPSYSVRSGKFFNRNDAKRAEDDAQLAGMHAFAKRDKVPEGK